MESGVLIGETGLWGAEKEGVGRTREERASANCDASMG